MLYPLVNAHRGYLNLGGVWSFRRDESADGTDVTWASAPLAGAIPMPVPASYNDITQDASLRDHLGCVWYERSFVVPRQVCAGRMELRFDAVAHHATVWLDGLLLGEYRGGFLPFVFDVTARVKVGATHRLTVRVNNMLTWQDMPPGEIRHPRDVANYPEGFRWQETHFDFFNYAGIHRPVRLVFTPSRRIERIRCRTEIDGTVGRVDYTVTASPGATVAARLRDADGAVVGEAIGSEGRITVDAPRLWSPRAPHLYRLEVSLADAATGEELDVYEERIGIRTVAVAGKRLLLNGEPVYLRGFGRHEDMDVKGRALDLALLVKDHNLMDWIGANSYRTSHYPYSEEAMRMADERGILVIDEVPAVGMNSWSHEPVIFTSERANDDTLAEHLRTLAELIERDANHPSVICWSVANEAATWEPASVPYFEKVCAHARALDDSRPLMIVEAARAITEPDRMPGSRVAHLADIVGVNRYYGWYNDPGRLDLVARQMERELRHWWDAFGKPILLAEYGADTIPCVHADPPQMFSEEFQADFLARYHEALDACDFVIGEHVWNFADFATKQGFTRVLGNRKGVFTRQRQPKQAAHALRARWTKQA
ncbi:MAG: beta-glucuronidase [Opitutaceae bacterium]|nr:beta-glucuronidase [Opitutaceae bacterium]